MHRALILAIALVVIPCGVSGQAPGVLHVEVVLADAAHNLTPVPRHALLVSDNPPTAPPRRIITAQDGTVSVKLRPGTYTVESDRPVAFNGQAYQWTQMVEISAGQDATLELTADNAEIGPVTATATSADAPPENDPSFLLPRWQDSVVALWTPSLRASGFVVDARGLVVTSRLAIGEATSVEVQLTPALKVAGRVLAADQVRDVAVLWIDPAVARSVQPVPLMCGQRATPVAAGQELFTIGAPLRGQKGLASGIVSRIGPHAYLTDFRLEPGSTGGPVFTAGGDVVGITSVVDETAERRQGNWRVVRTDDACQVLRSAETKMAGAAPPNGTHLPVEPTRPFPSDALQHAAQQGAGGQIPYQMSSSDFGIAFITPVLAHAAQQRSWQAGGRSPGGSTGSPEAAQERMRLLTDFGNWSEYVTDVPPVLLVRVTPKFGEGFWTMVARGAARTQGMAIPPIKHFKPDLSRMRVFCGTVEVTPIHAFELDTRVSANDVIHEGLYVFDPGALSPQCGTVKLVLYSEKEPQKGDTRAVDPRVLEQIWEDFAPYRVQAPGIDHPGA